MNVAAILHPSALEDLREAKAWYEAEQPGLGEDFALEVDAYLNTIRERPKSFRIIVQNIRSARLKKFKRYSILYEIISEETLYVYAVFHASRDPQIWERRVFGSLS